MATERDVKIHLKLDISTATAAKKAFGELGQEFKRANAVFDKLKASMNAPTLAKSVRLDLQRGQLEKQKEAAYAAERNRQQGVGTIGNLFKGFGAGKGMDAFQTMARQAGGGLSGMANVFGKVLGSGGSVTQGLGAVAKAAGPLGVALVTVGGALSKLYDIGMAGVAKASPGTAARLTRAWDDVHAVMGRMFIPVVEHVTSAVRLMGDVLAGILPSTQDVRQALAPLGEVFLSLRESASDAAPVLRFLGKVALGIVQIATTVFAKLFVFFSKLARIISPLHALGRLLGGGQGLPSSVGAAAGTASYKDLPSLGSEAALKTFSMAMEPSKVEKPENYLEIAAGHLATLVTGVNAINSVLGIIRGVMTQGERAANIGGVVARGIQAGMGY